MSVHVIITVKSSHQEVSSANIVRTGKLRAAFFLLPHMGDTHLPHFSGTLAQIHLLPYQYERFKTPPDPFLFCLSVYTTNRPDRRQTLFH